MHRALPASLLVLVVVSAGCSSSSASSAAPGSAASTPSTSATPATTPTPSPTAAPTPAPLPGRRLKALLAPPSWFPAGYFQSKDGAVDTRENDLAADVKPNLPCDRFNGTAWTDLSGVTPAAFAQDDYVSAKHGQYAQEFTTYTGTAAAQRAMTGLRKAAARCRSFHDVQTKGTITVRTVTGPQLGEDVLALRLTNPRWSGDTTLLAVRSGRTIVAAVNSLDGSSMAGATKLATYLTKRLSSVT